ncbi:relaxase/mobilization nuclease domain-containing protein [Aliirhizobium smilacinae]|uniref:MobA/VirD2-like nuclease domain-containing protein n=1 Tax=Aliirhizobium smilacinae TaxID=1395944 RepID=A0A5C4XC82_9HYPH|nr:hypothetical protein [Rhizobium smilacinae]TNM60330.1 hypothetical protein FHP24_26410 [Rhizobium smilacinae]
MTDRSKGRSISRSPDRTLPSYFELIEEENRRRGGGGGETKKRSDAAARSVRISRNAGAASAFSRATGNNAVVVKVLSYGAGARSAKNVLVYQSKEEKARDQDGAEVTDINAAVRSWEREFGSRKGSDDVLRITYELENTNRWKVAHALRLLADEGFYREGDTDRTYAFSVSDGVNGQTRLQFALVIAHEKKNRSHRIQGNRIAADIDTAHVIDHRLNMAMRSAGIVPVSRYPTDFSSGPKGFTATLHAMQRNGAEVTVSTKTQVVERPGTSGRYEQSVERRDLTTADHRELTKHGQLVGSLLQTRQPRDFMHLLLSGPANVDRDQFVLAGRDFLREQFAGHRFAYAVHNRSDKQKHPHLHVLVALRSATGRTLNPNIRDFTEWRLRFAEKARDRGIPIDRQKRLERAGPPPIKRWEWEMFQRMGATAPSNVIDRVVSKISDKPTAPCREDAKRRLEQTRRSVGRVIEMLDGLGRDRTAPSTVRELSQDLSVGLQREYQRLEIAVQKGRDSTREKGQENMLRSTPINAAQAKAAKQTLANTAVIAAAKITDPSDRLIFEQATKIIGKVVGLQLDSRVTKNRDRDAPRQSGALDTKSAAGRDYVAELENITKTSNDRSVDASRIARADTMGHDKDRSQPKERHTVKTTKLRSPQDGNSERGR